MGIHGRLLCTALVVMVSGAPVRADQPPLGQSYREVTPDGAHAFVMTDPHRVESNIRRSESTTGGVREILRTYTQCGPYCNDQSTEPL
jgi:hypothetical protein